MIEDMNKVLGTYNKIIINPTIRTNIDEKLLDSVIDHRKFYGITNDEVIRKQLNATSKYCRTVKFQGIGKYLRYIVAQRSGPSHLAHNQKIEGSNPSPATTFE